MSAPRARRQKGVVGSSSDATALPRPSLECSTELVRGLLPGANVESHTTLDPAAPAAPAARATKPNDAMVECPLCKMSWSAKMMLHHMGAHLLQESWAEYNQVKPQMPCGTCGVNESVGQFMVDPSQARGCPVSLTQGSTKRVWKPVHQCQLVGAIEYTLGAAATSTLETPCTNRPMKCKHCEEFIMTYSMAQHYSAKHSTTTMPPDLVAEIQLGKHERAHVSQLRQKRKVTSVCGGVTCCAPPASKKARRQ